MKRAFALLLSLLLLLSASSALAAKKPKATPTPLPAEIGTELAEPPEQIQRLLDIVYNEWVTVNGKVLDEPYIDAPSLGVCDIKLPYQVPENRFFVMGDHRSDSIDSRTKEIGCIAEEMVVGKVIWCIYPFGEMKTF